MIVLDLSLLKDIERTAVLLYSMVPNDKWSLDKNKGACHMLLQFGIWNVNFKKESNGGGERRFGRREDFYFSDSAGHDIAEVMSRSKGLQSGIAVTAVRFRILHSAARGSRIVCCAFFHGWDTIKLS